MPVDGQFLLHEQVFHRPAVFHRSCWGHALVGERHLHMRDVQTAGCQQGRHDLNNVFVVVGIGWHYCHVHQSDKVPQVHSMETALRDILTRTASAWLIAAPAAASQQWSGTAPSTSGCWPTRRCHTSGRSAGPGDDSAPASSPQRNPYQSLI